MSPCLFVLIAVRPLPGVIKVRGKPSSLQRLSYFSRQTGSSVFSARSSPYEIVDPAGEAGVHDRKILVRQRNVHDEIGLHFFDERDDLVDLVRVDLRGRDLRLCLAFELCFERVALGKRAAGYAQFGKHVVAHTTFADRDGRDAAAADDQYFCHDLSPVDDFGLHPHAAGRSALQPSAAQKRKNYPFSASSISRTILQATAVDAPL